VTIPSSLAPMVPSLVMGIPLKPCSDFFLTKGGGW
jgi:hypothetical protein